MAGVAMAGKSHLTMSQMLQEPVQERVDGLTNLPGPEGFVGFKPELAPNRSAYIADLHAEGQILEQRRALGTELRSAQQREPRAIEAFNAADRALHAAEAAEHEAKTRVEQCDAIAARALEELRIRQAEARALADRASKTAAALEIAEAASERASKARHTELQNAHDTDKAAKDAVLAFEACGRDVETAARDRAKVEGSVARMEQVAVPGSRSGFAQAPPAVGMGAWGLHYGRSY